MSFDIQEALFQDLARTFSTASSTNTEDLACADAIRGSLFRQQLSVIQDPCRNKAVLCPRRSGKSHCACSYAFDVCLRKPGAQVVVVTLTLKTAKIIYWNMMPQFATNFGVRGIEFFQNDMHVKFRNGSQMWLIGAESRAQIEKLRGGQYDLVIIDECKSYPAYVFEELVFEVIFPALTDRSGTILMIGTPGGTLSGLFFETTYPGWTDPEDKRLRSRDYYKPEPYWDDNPDELYWSRHYWAVEDNVAAPQCWVDMLEKKRLAKWGDDDPIWLREGLGKWAQSHEEFVYAYANLAGNPNTRDIVTWRPDFVNGNQWGLSKAEEWRYLLGVDVGYSDHTALVAAAYNVHEGILYYIWEYHAPEMDSMDVIERVQDAWERFGGFDAIVMDIASGGKLFIETLSKRFGMPIKAAEKTHKLDFIELMNSDFRSGNAKLDPSSDLAFQMASLQWDLSKGKFEDLARLGKLKENPSQPNDLCDAALYLWRYSYHYFRKDRPGEVIIPGTPQYYEKLHATGIADMLRQRKQVALDPAPHDPLRGFYIN